MTDPVRIPCNSAMPFVGALVDGCTIWLRCDTVPLSDVIGVTQAWCGRGGVVIWRLDGEDRIRFEREGGRTKGEVIG